MFASVIFCLGYVFCFQVFEDCEATCGHKNGAISDRVIWGHEGASPCHLSKTEPGLSRGDTVERPSGSIHGFPAAATLVYVIQGSLCLLNPPEAPQATAEVPALSLEALLNIEVTIASQEEESLVKAPSSVSVFSGTEIRNMGVRTLEELMNYVPGFQTARTDEYFLNQAPSARGRRSNATGLDILLLINGQRFNESWTGGWNAMAGNIATDNIQQVEFIRGPGSALYGSNAFLGVINIKTVTDKNEVFVAHGSFETYEASVQLSRANKLGHFSLFARQNFESEGESYGEEWGLPDIDGRVIDTTDPLDAFDVHLRWASPDEAWSLYLRETNRSQSGGVMIGIADNDDRQQWTEEATSINLEGKLVQGHAFNTTVSLQGLLNKRRTQIPLFPFGVAQELGITEDPRELRGGDVFNYSQMQMSVYNSWMPGYHFSAVFGGTFRRSDIQDVFFRTNWDTQSFFRDLDSWPVDVFEAQNTFNFSPLGDPKGQAGHRDVVGLYFQGRYHLNEQVTLTAGARYDDYSDFGDTINPRGALVWNTEWGASFKAMYGEAFRAPSIQEKSELSLIFEGNPDLGPENLQTTEFAWIQSFGNTGQVSVTWYTTDLENGVALAPGPPDEFGFSRDTPSNVVSLELSGFEFEGQLGVTERVVLRGSASHLTKAEENPRRVATNTVAAYLNYHNQKGLNLNLSGVYRGSIETGIGEDLAAYTVLNAFARYQYSEDMSFTVNIRNLLDEDYRTYTTSGSIQGAGLPERGRSVFIGLNWQLDK